MNPLTLNFFEPGLENSYHEFKQMENKRILSIFYIFLTAMQLLGLLSVQDEEEIFLCVTWSIIPVTSLVLSQWLMRKNRFFWLGLYFQRIEIFVYLMEFIIRRFSENNQRLSFFLGLLANSLNLKCDIGYSWLISSFEVLLCYIYFFIRTFPKIYEVDSTSIILLVITTFIMVLSFYNNDKKMRKSFFRYYKLSREKLFWRNFFEKNYEAPGFILKLKNFENKQSKYVIKQLFKSKASAKTDLSNSKFLKKIDFSLILSNLSSRSKLSVFSQEDLTFLFKKADIISDDNKTSQNIHSFEEVIETLSNSINSSKDGGFFSLKNNPNKVECLNKMNGNYSMIINGTKQVAFQKARLFIGALSGTKKSKFHKFVITLHAVDFEDELERLRELDKAKDKILANVTHDLRTPLNGIFNFIDQAMEIENKDERNKMLDYAKINSDLLLNLINDILDFSQYKEGKLRMCISTFSLLNIAEEVLKLLEFKAESKGVKLILSTNLTEDRPCESDPKRLKQVLINLIGNSLKFTNKGWIRLVITQTVYRNVLKFEIIDTGCGIKKEMINKLFNPFVTFTEGGNNNYGIGLGLTICQTIVQQLGPTEKMFVSSVYGKGTKIGFLLFTNHDRSNSFLKNSINFSEKSVTISRDSSIFVTNNQKSPTNLAKGTPNFVKSSFSTSNKPSEISSALTNNKRNLAKPRGLTEQLGILKASSVNAMNLESKMENTEKMPNESQTHSLGKKVQRKKPFGATKIIENWDIKKTMTIIKNADIKPDFSIGLPNPSVNNSSGVLSRSQKINCSDFFTSFSVLECESMVGYEVTHNGRSLELLPEDKTHRDDSDIITPFNKDFEEFEYGETLNRPTIFFKEQDNISFFSSESENRTLLKENAYNEQKIEKKSQDYGDHAHLTHSLVTEKPKEGSTNLTTKSLFFDKTAALKLKLEKIDEEANEEGKNDIRSSEPQKNSPKKKSFNFFGKLQTKPSSAFNNGKNFLNVLVVDDDPFNTMIICRFLEKVELPLIIAKATNGEEALELFKIHNKKNESQKPFHLIFMDCQMPLMNGYEASKNIKDCIKQGDYENCIVIAITAYNIQDEEEKCFLSGMDAVMMKPISEWEFNQLMKQFLVYEEVNKEK